MACAPYTFHGEASTSPSRRELAERLVHLGEQRARGHRDDDLLGQPPAELLGDLVAERLAALGVVRPDVDVHERPVLVLGDLAAQPVDVVVGALHRDERLVVHRRLHDLALLEVVRDEDDRTQAGGGGVRRDGVGEVAGAGAGDGRVAEGARRRQRHRHDAVLEGVRRVGAVVLDPQLPHAERGGEVLRLAQRRHAGAEADAGRLVLAGGQQAGVPPDALRPGRDALAGDLAQAVLVVGHLERREALLADVHRGERDLVPALAADQGPGGAGGEGRGDGQDCHVELLIFPAGRGTELAPGAGRAGCRGVIGPCPWCPSG